MAEPFEWSVAIWRAEPKVTALTTLARGVYRELLDAMHELDHSGVITGTREQLAGHGRCSVAELEQTIRELRNADTCEVHERNGIFTLVNRRMKRERAQREEALKREEAEREKNRLRVEKHRANRPSTLDPRPKKRSCNGPVMSSYKTDKGDKALSPLSLKTLKTEGECQGGENPSTPPKRLCNGDVMGRRKRLPLAQRELANRFEIILGHQWVNDAGKWVNRIKDPQTFGKSERVVAEVESALKENRIETTPAQYAEQIWKEFN